MLLNKVFDFNTDMPIGLKFALTQNIKALSRFANLSSSQQKAFIQGSCHLNSRQDMEAYVDQLLQGF